MKVLITGGAGYIGSTIYSALEDNGHNPVILDSFINGDPKFVEDRNFYEGDISDAELLGQIVNDHQDIEIVIHCAALIRVPESMKHPSRYYYNNVIKSIK
ncbi:NAD-dependent epimerase/dehydratase family protein, partial [Dehalococcoidia bacterium]|nr:NAD-dependent epimerase/dehydratase family protein [Dehalococcoidia bacterium]